MSGEITGMKMNPTCKPHITSTLTEEVWKQRIKEGGWFVKQHPASSDADYMGVTFLADNDTETVGRLIGFTGSGDSFKVSVETQGVRGYAQGSGSGALATGDYGQYCKATGGKLEIDSGATAGNIKVVGGNKKDLMVAWSWPTQK